jgi:hypothetical protein
LKVKENHTGKKRSGTSQYLVYADDVNLLRENLNVIMKSTDTLTDAIDEAGIEENLGKTN